MKNLLTSSCKKLLPLVSLVVLLSCNNEKADEEPQPQPLNSFEMNLNGQAWQPSKLGEDECMRSFHGAWTGLTSNGRQTPYYTVWAYKDPQGITNYKSENAFEFQITDVSATGRYDVVGSHKENFESYAIFTVNKPDGTYSRYVNKATNGSFVVEINKLLPITQLGINGIKGSFYGTLYNENNPQDSLVLQRGEFTLQKMNWYNFNQCSQ